MKELIFAITAGLFLGKRGDRIIPLLKTILILCLFGEVPLLTQLFYSGIDSINDAIQAQFSTEPQQNPPTEPPLNLDPLEERAYAEAQRNGIDPTLFFALITQESAWNPAAVSPKGAIGLGQIMPFNAAACGLVTEELYEVDKNLACSIFFLKKAIVYWEGIYPDDKDKATRHALAEYNAGRDKAKRALSSFPETRKYVSRIMNSTTTFLADKE